MNSEQYHELEQRRRCGKKLIEEGKQKVATGKALVAEANLEQLKLEIAQHAPDGPSPEPPLCPACKTILHGFIQQA